MKLTLTFGEIKIEIEDGHVILDAISIPVKHTLVPPEDAEKIADETIKERE